jgi:hypothetical protein
MRGKWILLVEKGELKTKPKSQTSDTSFAEGY